MPNLRDSRLTHLYPYVVSEETFRLKNQAQRAYGAVLSALVLTVALGLLAISTGIIAIWTLAGLGVFATVALIVVRIRLRDKAVTKASAEVSEQIGQDVRLQDLSLLMWKKQIDSAIALRKEQGLAGYIPSEFVQRSIQRSFSLLLLFLLTFLGDFVVILFAAGESSLWYGGLAILIGLLSVTSLIGSFRATRAARSQASKDVSTSLGRTITLRGDTVKAWRKQIKAEISRDKL